MQRLIVEDVVVIMNYERGIVYVQEPRLKGVVRRAVGTDPDYTAAYLVDDPVTDLVLAYSLKRLVQGIITVWFIATATFVAMHAVPGDPLTGERAPTRANPRESRSTIRSRQAGDSSST